jgi:hypothetical protein
VKRRRKRIGPALMAWGMLLLAGAVFGVFLYQAAGFGKQEQSLVASTRLEAKRACRCCVWQCRPASRTRTVRAGRFRSCRLR